MAAGQSARSAATIAFTWSTVSMMFCPGRFLTSRETAWWPLRRAKLVGSLNDRRTRATSRNRTTRSPSLLTGSSRMSCRFSNTAGTFTAKRPRPVSMVPAGTSRLLREMRLNMSAWSRP